jgi:RNA polymerase sigma factor (TIGR02999 family)
MTDSASSQITQLLHQLGQADERASPPLREQLFVLVYEELRRTAQGLMRRERAEHTLQPTALVHESYLRLVEGKAAAFADRAHFLGIAARCMRQILVDHARARASQKRGGDRQRVTLDTSLAEAGTHEFELLVLDDALSKFARLDPRAAQVAELRLFGGLAVDEIAHTLGISARTVDGDWASARLWLSRELSDA